MNRALALALAAAAVATFYLFVLSPSGQTWFLIGLAIYVWFWLCRRFPFFGWLTFGFVLGLLSGGRSGYSGYSDDNDYRGGYSDDYDNDC